MNNIFQNLNPQQLEAVQSLDGPLLILAGAGSGKTKTLTHRIANLLKNNINESNILAVTFTNKAANEMRERLWRIITDQSNPPRSFMPYMGTFHGICVRILHMEHEAAGLDKNFTILDTEDQVSLIKRIMKELKVDNKALKPKSVLSIISKAKNENISPDEYLLVVIFTSTRNLLCSINLFRYN